MQEVARDDWVIVTNNAIEFRGRYSELELHPGVLFLLPNVRRVLQAELLLGALAEIERDPDLVNQALDVSFSGETVVVRRYKLP